MAEVVIGLALTAATVISQRNAAKKQEAAQNESIAVQSASEDVKDRNTRRTSAREERIRRARLLQASSTGGTEGSSGEVGASSAIGSNFGSVVARQSEDKQTAAGITAAGAREARAVSRAKTFSAYAKLAQQGLDVYDDYSE